jgi:hypothetical protein
MGPLATRFGTMKKPQQGAMHICHFAIFRPIENKILNLE